MLVDGRDINIANEITWLNLDYVNYKILEGNFMIEEKLNFDQKLVLNQLKIFAETQNNVFGIISSLYTYNEGERLSNEDLRPLYEARKALRRLLIVEESEVLEVFAKWVQTAYTMELELENKEAETIVSVLGLADQISVSSEDSKDEPKPFFDSEKLEEIKILQERIEQQRRETFVDESLF